MRQKWSRLPILAGLLGLAGLAAAQSPTVSLKLTGTHQVTVAKEQDVYVIHTTGGDPYLFSEALEKDLAPDERVLTFDYFAPKYLDHLQVFFGPPIAENFAANSELGIREGWTSHSIRIPSNLGHWGKKGDLLRFDFGRNAGYQVRIRNIHFRKLNDAEIKREAEHAELKAREAAQVHQLQQYLQTDFPAKVRQVTVNGEQVIVSGELPKAEKGLFLAEIEMQDDLYALTAFQHLTPIPEEARQFALALDRYRTVAGGRYDRLLSKWAIVRQKGASYEVLSHGRNADEITCTTRFDEEPLRGKKGIGGFFASRNAPVGDVDSLGITSVTVNMWITQMMRSEPSDNHIPFEYNGKTYYALRSWVEGMDRTLQFCAGKKLIVSSIILIEKTSSCADKEIGRIFEHPDCDPSGIYSMANMTSAEGVEYYAAAIDFLAKRYNTNDNRYGRIHHWIVHNEVDAGWVWTNMGEKHPQLFMDTYHKSMRLIHNIARQYNPYSKAFISLTHFWAWTEDKHFYHSDELLDMLLTYSKREGDFEWAIAHHPYPQSLFEPKSWQDDKAEFHMKTPIISFKNIEVLDAWVKQPATMFQGKTRRTVFLSEQGPNSKDYSPQNLQEQAASMAYVWKKMDVLDGIDAFQFHNWIDNRGEGGLRIGLRRFPDDAEDPLGKKPVWYVFRDIGTPREETGTAFAKKIIEITDWNEVIYKGPIPAAP